MAERNFSMIEYFNRLAAEHVPEMSFQGETEQDWRDWREKGFPKLKELLGSMPEPAELNPEVVYGVEENGLTRERVVIDTEEHMSVPCVVLKPVDMADDGANAAIVCSHGHGLYGKESVTGNRSLAEIGNRIEQHNYNYGEQMARHGYLTISPDLRVFGERSDGGDPYPGRDPCNVQFIRGMILGVYTLTLNIFDMTRIVDYLETRPEVDPEHIGMMGLSQGGTMTTFTTAVEPRIKAADIIGYMATWRGMGIKDANFCGSQVVPDIFRYFDIADVAGFIAPRPLLLEMGIQDTCFHIDEMLPNADRVKEIYRAAGAAEDLHMDIHPGGHAFAGNKAFDFFDRYL
ncbi:MAG: alpha/beta hydrolase [Candidatus Brocadiia bacterium]